MVGDAVVVDGSRAHEAFQIPLDAVRDVPAEISAHQIARVRQSVGKPRRFRIQQQPGGFDGGAAHGKQPGLHFLFLAGDRVDHRHRTHTPFRIHQQLACSPIFQQREISGAARFRNHGRGGGKDRADVAALHAMAAIVARGPAVVRLGQDGFAHRNHRNTKPGTGAFHDFFRASKLERRQVLAIRDNIHVFARARYANHLFDVRIVRCEFLITDGPVFFDALDAPLAEIPLGKTQADGVPVNRAATDGADAVHADVVGTFVADGLRHFRRIERLATGARRAAIRILVGPRVKIKILGSHHAAGLDQRHLGAGLGQFLGQHAAGWS